MKLDDEIAEIIEKAGAYEELSPEEEAKHFMSFAIETILDNKEIEGKLNLVGEELTKDMWRFVALCRVVRKLLERLEQCEGHLLNLEGRQPKKQKDRL